MHERNRKLHSLYLTDDEYERVQAAAAAEGVSFQDFVRGLLNRYVKPAPPAPISARVTLLEERMRAMEAKLGIDVPQPKDPDFGVQGELPKTRRARKPQTGSASDGGEAGPAPGDAGSAPE